MKNLIAAPNLILNDNLKRTIELLDPYFEGYPVTITSGVRTVRHQLEIIVEKVKRHGIDKLFSEFNHYIDNAPEIKVDVDRTGKIYWWQRPWCKCLSIGDIVNPPLPADVLFDYWRPPHENKLCGDPDCETKHNKKGRVIDVSQHQKGNSFDLGGGGHDLKEIEKRVYEAEKSGKCFIHGHLFEDVNNAIHVDVVPA